MLSFLITKQNVTEQKTPKKLKETFGGEVYLYYLDIMISQLYPCVQSHQIVYIKYVIFYIKYVLHYIH